MLDIRLHDKPLPKGLSNTNVKNILQNYHNKFVFCPTDKAANNIAIVCKHFYASKIIKELDLDNNNPGNKTYERITNLREEDIVREHVNFLKLLDLKLTI